MRRNRFKLNLGQRISYHVDNIIGMGTPALIVILFLIFLFAAFLTSLLLLVQDIPEIEGRPIDVAEAYWVSLMHVIDQGTLTGDMDWRIRLTMFFTTFLGIFLVSSLVSILNTGFSTKIQELKRGRSLVLEEGHTVILGWSPKVFTIISELVIANENQRRSCIVILAEKEIDFMKDEVYSKVGSTGRTKIIYRYGNPRDANDIIITNLNTAKSIIIPAPEDANADAYVIKTIMAILNNPTRKKEPFNIIAEIKNEVNRSITEVVGKEEVTIVVSNEIISKILVQTSRQTGLSLIYNDLIDYTNVEIYILQVKGSAGYTFGDIILGLDDVMPIGIRKLNGEITIKPNMEEIIGVEDKLVVLAEDDIEVQFDKTKIWKNSGEKFKSDLIPKQKKEQKTLILGWNQNGRTIVKELDNYVLSGSEVFIVAEAEDLELKVKELNSNLINQKVSFKTGDINDRTLLNEIDLGYFDYVIILSYSDKYGIQEADALTLITLMHVRDISKICNKRFNIVSEILDVKNRMLAGSSKADDFIISDQIISLVLAQLSENKELIKIFEELFDATGNEIYLKPASYYTQLNQATDFYNVIINGIALGDLPIGYKIDAYSHDEDKNYGIMLNPVKSEKVTFTEEDKIIVIAAD